MLMLFTNMGERQEYKTSVLLPGKVSGQLCAVSVFAVSKTLSR
jgi:hypothetical protein